MKEFMMIGTSTLGPKIGTDQSDLEGYFSDILFECKYIFMLLDIINHFIFKKQH
jgi:hypothetical protein